MFGEEILLGQTELTIDKKGRMFVPADTKREEGEKLVLLYDKDIDVYKIYSAEKIERILDKMKNKVKNSTNILEKTNYKKELYEFCESILKCSKVESKGRIVFGSEFGKEFEDGSLLSIGCGDHLLIKPIKK